jgi:hypothetical protein
MPRYDELNGLNQPDNTINTLQSLLSLANQKQQYLTPELNQPYLGLQGAPASGTVMRDLGTLAAAINPKSFGGRLGAGMAQNVGEYEEDARRNLAARVGLGRYGMEHQQFQDEMQRPQRLQQMLQARTPDTTQTITAPGLQQNESSMGLTGIQGLQAPPVSMTKTIPGVSMEEQLQQRFGDLYPLLKYQMMEEKGIPGQVFQSLVQPKNDVPSSIKELETVYGLSPEKRGTPAYQQAFENMKTLGAQTYGNKRFQMMMQLPTPVWNKESNEAQIVTREESLSDPKYVPMQSPEAKQAMPTESTKTMQQAAPKVIDFTKKIRDIANAESASLGPASSRWREFWTGKIGSPDKTFTKLRTDVGLLQTLLMRMHVGARGGEYIMKHFQDLLDAGKQSPENMISALDAIEDYANDVKNIKSSDWMPTPGENNPTVVTPTGKSISGRDYWIWPDGINHYSPPPK